MKKKVNEGLEMDMTTYKKVKGTLDPKTPIKITDEKPEVSTSLPTSSVQENAPEAVIEPQDTETIKWVSNVKDKNGEISKPFTISGKKYEMVRGRNSSNNIVMAVYCHDDINEKGENIIYPVDYFEKAIAEPAKRLIQTELPVTETPKEEKLETPKTDTSLKLSEYKHFIIDKKTGKVRKFKRAEELAKANMSETETYMNLQQFKKHVDETLFGVKSKKNNITEENPIPEKPDVKLAIDQMTQKVKPYINKLNEPIEKIQFLVKLTTMLNLDSSKYPLLMAELKKSSTNTFDTAEKPSSPTTTTLSTSVYEGKILTKNELIKSLEQKEKTIKIVKIKDIK